MLDTNACIAVMTGREPAVREQLALTKPEQISVSAVVVAELRYGISYLAPERQSSNSEALRAFLQEVEVLDWPSQAADLYGEVRAELRRRGKPIGANDLLIGCHALQLQRVLVTHNVREFDRIPGLKLEDWAQI
ncbi:MAG: virulence-associated protein VapC1 [Cyanobacteriota bacterium]|jgi:tRNA(fMet)-specific endonuclease VapC